MPATNVPRHGIRGPVLMPEVLSPRARSAKHRANILRQESALGGSTYSETYPYQPPSGSARPGSGSGTSVPMGEPESSADHLAARRLSRMVTSSMFAGRDAAHDTIDMVGKIGHTFLENARLNNMQQRFRQKPAWVGVLQQAYHRYGGKHVMLMLVLILYAFLGGAVFLFLEEGSAENRKEEWKENVAMKRFKLVQRLMPQIFNNSIHLLYLDPDTSVSVENIINASLSGYEIDLGIKYTDQKIQWDFWNAMLYAGTICTTIGYGHLYPTTTAGRIATMVYAIFGIPLVLSILDDLGKLLTVVLKYPWMLVKMLCRRVFRYCTKQSMDEIRRLDQLDREGLAIFDLPIPVAIIVVVLWIFICSATFCIWETEWDYFRAFYFFFVSLSTIGLGDIVPARPRLMLMMFFYIIIGLSLVSMCVNLIQMKLERTYEKGKEEIEQKEATLEEFMSKYHGNAIGEAIVTSKLGGAVGPNPGGSWPKPPPGTRATMGVLRSSDSRQSIRPISVGSIGDGRAHRLVQTVISFPSPSHIPRDILRSQGARFVSTSRSVEDVIRLVNIEENDIILLSEIDDRKVLMSAMDENISGAGGRSQEANLIYSIELSSTQANDSLFAAGGGGAGSSNPNSYSFDAMLGHANQGSEHSVKKYGRRITRSFKRREKRRIVERKLLSPDKSCSSTSSCSSKKRASKGLTDDIPDSISFSTHSMMDNSTEKDILVGPSPNGLGGLTSAEVSCSFEGERRLGTIAEDIDSHHISSPTGSSLRSTATVSTAVKRRIDVRNNQVSHQNEQRDAVQTASAHHSNDNIDYVDDDAPSTSNVQISDVSREFQEIVPTVTIISKPKSSDIVKRDSKESSISDSSGRNSKSSSSKLKSFRKLPSLSSLSKKLGLSSDGNGKQSLPKYSKVDMKQRSPDLEESYCVITLVDSRADGAPGTSPSAMSSVPYQPLRPATDQFTSTTMPTTCSVMDTVTTTSSNQLTPCSDARTSKIISTPEDTIPLVRRTSATSVISGALGSSSSNQYSTPSPVAPQSSIQPTQPRYDPYWSRGARERTSKLRSAFLSGVSSRVPTTPDAQSVSSTAYSGVLIAQPTIEIDRGQQPHIAPIHTAITSLAASSTARRENELAAPISRLPSEPNTSIQSTLQVFSNVPRQHSNNAYAPTSVEKPTPIISTHTPVPNTFTIHPELRSQRYTAILGHGPQTVSSHTAKLAPVSFVVSDLGDTNIQPEIYPTTATKVSEATVSSASAMTSKTVPAGTIVSIHATTPVTCPTGTQSTSDIQRSTEEQPSDQTKSPRAHQSKIPTPVLGRKAGGKTAKTSPTLKAQDRSSIHPDSIAQLGPSVPAYKGIEPQRGKSHKAATAKTPTLSPSNVDTPVKQISPRVKSTALMRQRPQKSDPRSGKVSPGVQGKSSPSARRGPEKSGAFASAMRSIASPRKPKTERSARDGDSDEETLSLIDNDKNENKDL